MSIMGQQFIFKTVKMWIPQNEDWIPWNDHWRRKNIHGHFEVKRNLRLAHSFYCQTSQRIFRIWKLLLMIYPKLLWHRTTSEWTLKEGQKIWLDPRMSIFLWGNEEIIHRRTCLLGDAPLRPTFPPIFLRHLCIFLLIVASPRWSSLVAPIAESDGHVT